MIFVKQKELQRFRCSSDSFSEVFIRLVPSRGSHLSPHHALAAALAEVVDPAEGGAVAGEFEDVLYHGRGEEDEGREDLGAELFAVGG